MAKDSITENIDPIRLEIVRHRLGAIADEMGLALRRTAYSTNIKTRLDFSCAVFDGALRVIAQSFSQPVHLGSLVHFVPQIIATYGAERLGPGDGILCNDGHRGGVHLNDVCLVSPVFHEDQIVAFVATLAHHLDVGGGTPGSMVGLSREVFEEGLRIPPVRFLRSGQVDEEIFRLLENNVRSPRETGGDLRAQIAGVKTGTRRIHQLIDKYGLNTFKQTTAALMDYTERRARDEINKIPLGVYCAHGHMDDDGRGGGPIRVVVKITVRPGQVVFDLTGSDGQRKGPVNATYAMTLSNCAYALRVLMDPDLPVNDGFYRTFKVIAPSGSVVNAQYPSAIGGGWETAFRVCETAMQAFAKAVLDRLAAGSKGCLSNIAFGGISPRSGEYYVFYESMGGGYGARATKDGIDAVQPHGQNTENAPVEETEANYPVRIVRYELIPDSEGAGRFRGGLGLRRDYLFDHDVVFSVLADRAKFAPWGLAGGWPARPAHYVLNPDTNSREYPSKTSIELHPGDVFSVQMGGGGGYGPPWERDEERVREDVLAGKISLARACEIYGVVIDLATGAIDPVATGSERAILRRRQLESAGEKRLAKNRSDHRNATDRTVDFRSDAVTTPTEAMWDAMRNADCGWAYAGEDSSVNALQSLAAALTGKDAALFVPTGTMANLLALMTHATRGDQIVAEASSHILWSEEWGYAYVCGLVPRPVEGQRGSMAPEQVREAIIEERLGHRARTGLICVENTHNMAGGTITTREQMAAIANVAHEFDVSIHVDGARILNAAVALGTDLHTLAEGADSLALSLTKGLSAPFGALLCGSLDFVDRSRSNLKRLGGWSVHKAGIYAAAGLVALRSMPPQLAEDNRRALLLSRELEALRSNLIRPWPVETNIVLVSVDRSWMSARTLAGRLADNGIKVSVRAEDAVRFVIHRHITDGDIHKVVRVVTDIAANR